MTNVADAARRALAAGLNPWPPKEDGTKMPMSEPIPAGCQDPACMEKRARAGEQQAFGWTHRHHARVTEAELADLYRDGRSGVGIVCGAVSGGLEMLEFEGLAVREGVYVAFHAAAEAAGLADLVDRVVAGYCEQSPGGGVHLLYRCPAPHSLKLARRPATAAELAEKPDEKTKLLVETKGEGGYVITAPTNGKVHHTGGAYQQMSGGFATIVTITAAEHDALLALAGTLDATEPAAQEPSGVPPPPARGLRPGDDFNNRADWHDDVLGPAGYTLVKVDGADEYWHRPGSANEYGIVVHTDSDLLVPFTTSTDFPATEKGYGKFPSYTYLHHGGDFRAARRALRAQGYGSTTATDDEVGDAGTLPEEFWSARPILGHIRDGAHHQQRSAAAILHAILARVAASIPHRVKLPDIVGDVVPLCYFVVVVANSGVGKSGANGVARRLLPMGGHVLEPSLGSGEGLVELLFDWVTEPGPDGKAHKVKQQVHFNMYVYVDEGQILDELGNRKGATLLPTLRTIFTGGPLGSANADRDRRRYVPAGRYSVGICVGMQRATAQGLLADVAKGTPQRFAWAAATEPALAEEEPERTEWPGPIDWKMPWPDVDTIVNAYNTHLVEIAEPVADEIRRVDRLRVRGQYTSDPLDSHAELVRLKQAALLGILDGRLSVTEDDWRLAGMLSESSRAVRDDVVRAVKAEGAKVEAATRERMAGRAVASDAAVETRRVAACARKIAEKVWAEPDRWTENKMRGALSKLQRDVFADALDVAVAKGWIVVLIEASHTDSERRALRPGEKRP